LKLLLFFVFFLTFILRKKFFISVCKQGDVGDAMYLIYKGKLGVYRNNKFGEMEFMTNLAEGF
jgi:hypothetical protein